PFLMEPPEIIRRKVKAYRDALLAKSVDELPCKVLAVGSVADAEGSCTAVPHTEAGVGFGGKHDVLEAGERGGGRPSVRLEAVGIELAGEDAKEALDVIG